MFRIYGLGLYASNVQKTIIVHLPISSRELKLQDVVIMTGSIPFCFLILPVFYYLKNDSTGIEICS